MTPQEKAKELVDRFYSTNSHPNSVEVRSELAKQCALIAVDEIMNIGWNLPHYDNIEGVEYWQQVKQEINKL